MYRTDICIYMFVYLCMKLQRKHIKLLAVAVAIFEDWERGRVGEFSLLNFTMDDLKH